MLGAMRGDDRLAEVAAALLATHAKKARRRVDPAAAGDVEGVHGLRVAIRKIRGVLSLLDDAGAGGASLARRKRRLDRLFKALGAVRDGDVLSEQVEALVRRRRLRSGGVEALREAVEAVRRRANKRLRAEVRRHPPAETLKGLARDARKVAREAVKDPSVRDGDDVVRSLVRHHAGGLLLARYEAVIAYEVALPASQAVLHRLRVAIKKLRYAIDFFSGALDGHVAALDAPLSRAQEQLGELHDRAALRAFLAGLDHSPSGSLEALRAANDARSERLLPAFDVTWAELRGRPFVHALAAGLGALLGPGARPDTLALRHAESLDDEPGRG